MHACLHARTPARTQGLTAFRHLVAPWLPQHAVNLDVPDHPEPEQSFLLGNRWADYGLSLLVALALPQLRALLNAMVYEVRGVGFSCQLACAWRAMAPSRTWVCAGWPWQQHSPPAAKRSTQHMRACAEPRGQHPARKDRRPADSNARAHLRCCRLLQPYANHMYRVQRIDMDKTKRVEWLRKFKESAWKLTIFATFTITAFLVSYQEAWFTDTRCAHGSGHQGEQRAAGVLRCTRGMRPVSTALPQCQPQCAVSAPSITYVHAAPQVLLAGLHALPPLQPLRVQGRAVLLRPGDRLLHAGHPLPGSA